MSTPLPLVNTSHRLRKTVGLHLGAATASIALLDATDSALRFGQDDQGRRTFPLTGDPDLKQVVQQLRIALAQVLDDRRYVLDAAVLTMSAAHDQDRQAQLKQLVQEAGLEVVATMPEPFTTLVYYHWASGHGNALYLVAFVDRGQCSATVAGILHDDLTTPIGWENYKIEDGSVSDRVVDCCWQALNDVSVSPAAIDYVLLAGSSDQLAAVAAALRAAFCDPALPEHTVHPEPLVHEPELCATAGAAIHGARLGTHYLLGDSGGATADVHLTSPPNTRVTAHELTGIVNGSPPLPAGSSLLVQALATGLVEEAFLDEQGAFRQALELTPDSDNGFLLTLCDDLGRELATLPATVRHSTQERRLGQTVAATEVVTRPLQIEVLDQRRRRVRQTLAPVGATLPNTFACICRTTDQAGRVVVPLYEDNRLLQRVVVGDLDPTLPVGVPVELELQVDAAHALRLKVTVRHAGRMETVTLAATPPPKLPTSQEIDTLRKEIETELTQFTGIFHTRNREQLTRLLGELDAALQRHDESAALEHAAALRELRQVVLGARSQVLEPPWQRFAQLVRQCLIQAGNVAERTGRSREELFEQVYAQERYAEQAYAEKNQTLYRECFENLSKFAAYLDQLGNDFSPGAAARGRARCRRRWRCAATPVR